MKRCQAVTYVYPTQSDEIVLVLYEEKFLLVFRVAIVRATVLLRYDDVGNSERISGLGKKSVMLEMLFSKSFPTASLWKEKNKQMEDFW